MTVHLPEDLERSIRDGVRRGHFASVDDAVAEAVRAYLRAAIPGPTPSTGREEATGAHKPIWEEFEEIASGIPDEEWAKLPTDGAEQHDHYIYGTPKRPTT